MKYYIKLMRVHHYIKNFLVFAALACSGQFFNSKKLLPNIIAFITFCLTSSIVYIINDIRDKERDRCHPTKCNRPIASSAIPVKNAVLLAIGLLLIIASLCICWSFSIASILLLILYLTINLAYSFGLKNIPLVDITILVAGFLIRILYGAYITEIPISNWLYLTVFALAFYFALGKRRNELKQMGVTGETRHVLKSYPPPFLDKNMHMCLTLANVFYALWSMDDSTMSLYDNQYLIFTVPIVFLITLKYSMNIEADQSDGDPVEVLLHDKILLILCILYISTMFFILYL